MNSDKVTDYKRQAETLFQEWKGISGTVEYTVKKKTETMMIDHRNSIFIKDGVVCPEKWFSQNIRPLFLLKEAYGGQADWNLIEDHLLQTYSINKMWNRISLWTKGIFATTKETIAPFEEADLCATHYGNDYLKKIAVINVKKSGGENNSDMDIIRAYAKFDKERLKKQLQLCDPTVIICGYTSSTLDIIMDCPVRKNYNPNLSYHMTINGHDVLILDYWHPANQYPDLMNYYGLMGIYQAGLKEIAHG